MRHYLNDGSGFAHQIIQCSGQWDMTGATGTDGYAKLKLAPIGWRLGALLQTAKYRDESLIGQVALLAEGFRAARH